MADEEVARWLVGNTVDRSSPTIPLDIPTPPLYHNLTVNANELVSSKTSFGSELIPMLGQRECLYVLGVQF